MRAQPASARSHGPARPLRLQHRRRAPARQHIVSPPRAIDIDFSDSDTWVGIAAVVLGLGLGIGAPIFYTQRIDEDEKSLEELRKRNRENFKETGEYLSEVRPLALLCDGQRARRRGECASARARASG